MPAVCMLPAHSRHFAVTGDYRSDYRADLLRTFPSGVAAPMDGLEGELAADRDEAWGCFYAGHYRAAIIMGRAAIQRAVRQLGATGANLKQEIASLMTAGTITTTLGDLADESRIAGNDAAHPEDMATVSKEETEANLQFMDQFLEVAVAIPALIAARKASRS